MLCFCFFRGYCLFFSSDSAVFVGEGAKIFSRSHHTLAMPLVNASEMTLADSSSYHTLAMPLVTTKDIKERTSKNSIPGQLS